MSKKISALDTVTPAAGAFVPILQAGVNKKASIASILAKISVADIIALELAHCPRRDYQVWGDSIDGGTTPDAETQASIDALLAAGVPANNIVWRYYAIPADGTFIVSDITVNPEIDNVTITLTGGSFVVDGMSVSIGIDNVTLTQDNTFIIDGMTVTPEIDDVTLASGIHPNLVDYWTFDVDGASATGNNTLVATNGPTITAGGQVGNCGTMGADAAALFTKTSAIAGYTDSADKYTICLWADAAPSLDRILLIASNNADSNQMSFSMTATSPAPSVPCLRAYINNNGTQYDSYSAEYAPTNGVWTHYAFVVDMSQAVASKVLFYINGSAVANLGRRAYSNNVTAISGLTDYIQVGGRSTGRHVNRIDDVQVYRGIALSASDITRVYQGLVPLETA